MKNPTFKKSDAEIINCRQGYSGFFEINEYTVRHRTFEGGWSNELSREVFERGHAVCVLPYDPVRDEVVLIEQFRTGALVAMKSKWFDDDASPWLYEAIAGIIDPGESPADVAYREAKEEAGTTLTDLIPISHYLVSPGGTTETVFNFIGRADASNIAGVHGLREEGEDIRPFAIPLQQAYDAIEDGKINNGYTIVPLQWLMLNKERVRTKWS